MVMSPRPTSQTGSGTIRAGLGANLSVQPGLPVHVHDPETTHIGGLGAPHNEIKPGRVAGHREPIAAVRASG